MENRRWVLASVPNGKVKLEDLREETVRINPDSLKENEVLVKNETLTKKA